MNWKEIYKSRLCTADEAVRNIRSGETVVLAHAVGEPPALTDALVANAERFENVEIRHMVSLGLGKYAAPGMEKHFRVNPMFAGANVRACLAEGRGDFTPAFFHEVPKLFRTGQLTLDVLMCQVSPPDEHGYCSLGTSVDYTLQALKSARLVLAQVNSNFPCTYGESFVHVSEIDHFVEADAPMFEIKPPTIGDVEKSIGEHCASLVEDGSTLQLGIGGIPDAVMLFLKDKKDLGIHSEMISDGTLELFESGVITNRKKSENVGKMTVAFLMGTEKLYRFAHKNPAVEVRPVDYVNHPIVVSRQHKIVSINSAIQIDLQGQVDAEAMGLRQFSGVGGQVDFIRGAAMSDGGKAIIAMPSVTIKKDGSIISKIVPFLDEGAPVTTSRNDIDYVVTEYGIAPLKGQSLRQRARHLINIAHPDKRAELVEEFEKRFSDKF
ncbi:MAG: 4-hydroxybutyrate CoA-transferase [Clostridiales Family XIII bacterium]|nr:4-hydroxybutyrate CoA-transferase [Clostridiales Family XIII bacterium]